VKFDILMGRPYFYSMVFGPEMIAFYMYKLILSLGIHVDLASWTCNPSTVIQLPDQGMHAHASAGPVSSELSD
jgi:hypothetical protein